MASDVEIIDLTELSIASDDSMREFDRDISKDASLPWYHDPDGSHPFSLTVKGQVSPESCLLFEWIVNRRIQATSSPAPSFRHVEFFPWAETPLEHLWNGELYTTKDDPRSWWSYLVAKWKNTAAMCGGKVVRLISTLPQHWGQPIFQVALPAEVSDDLLLSIPHLYLYDFFSVSIYCFSCEMGTESVELTPIAALHTFKHPARV